MSLLERYVQPGESQLPTVSHHGEIPSGQPTVEIVIDGQTVTALAGETILRAAQRAGFSVPTLCDDEKLAPATACRMCLVEVAGYEQPMPSCHLAVEPGMSVTSTNEGLFALRKQNLEYILSDHNAYCMPPCQVGCPTHIDIPGYLELMTKGQHVEAARLVKEVLPFPYALGLVCPAPCQEVCRRGLVEEEIAIRQCHGYGGELSLEMDVAPTPFPQEVATGKRVAVIGAGPAGLTAAYYLALKGHGVTVFDRLEKQGGMLRYGIPEYRLPKVKLDKELNCVWQLRDAEFKGGMELGRDFTVDDLFTRGYDAVFLGIGADVSNEMRVPGEDLPGVLPAVKYLRDNASGNPVAVGKGTRVIVLGGGFTAFDCARTSRRLGADVTIAYRRSRKEMGAHYSEVDDAEHEGIKLEFFLAPTRVVEKDGRVGGVEFQRMQLGEPDASGRRRPIAVAGSEFVMECDVAIAAFGQTPDLTFMDREQGLRKTRRDTVITNAAFMTDRPGVFAGGDAVIGASTVIQCVGQSKLAAKAIDRYLAGADMAEIAAEIAAEEEVPELIDIVPYKPEEPQVRMPFLPFSERVQSFELIESGYDKAAAEKEAARCLQCVCPDAGRCHLQRLSLEHGLTENKFHRGEPADYHDYEYDFSHDFILRDLNKCINCTQCVRICRDVIGANCYGLMGSGWDSIVTTPWNASLQYTDCVSCGACAETCPTGALMLRERDLNTYEIDVVRCIYCGDCVEVCPHGALGETPNFELATYKRFGVTVLAKEELAGARTWKASEAIPLDGHEDTRPPEIPAARPAALERLSTTLRERLVARIRARGPMTFADYMDACLYDPSDGYYTTRAAIGFEGDFLTSPDLGPVFGRSVARAVGDLWGALDRPAAWDLVEAGAGRGTLMRDVLGALARERSDAARGVRPAIVDVSPHLREQQGLTLEGTSLRWAVDVQALAPVSGIVFANEVLDAFPVHVLVKAEEGVREVFVDEVDGALAEVVRAPSHADLRWRVPEALPIGGRWETSPAAEGWVAGIGAALSRGYLLLVDYGGTEASLLTRQGAGTVRGFSRHRLVQDPLADPGGHDLTASVDFTAVRRAAEGAGLRWVGSATQRDVLLALGTREAVRPSAPASADLERLRAASRRSTADVLLDPNGLGAFVVALFAKDAPTEGLRMFGAPSGYP